MTSLLMDIVKHCKNVLLTDDTSRLCEMEVATVDSKVKLCALEINVSSLKLS